MATEQNTYELGYISLVNYQGKEIIISQMVESLSISQSIFNSTMYGDLSITDAEDLHTGLPFIGEERLKVKYRTNEDFDWVEQEFVVHSVSDKIRTSQNQFSYIVSFCSPEMITSQFQTVSTAFTSKTVKQAVSSVFKYLSSKKPVEIEDTIGNINFVVPSWSPLKTINNLAGKSQSQKHYGASFLFYETQSGFKFKSIESMYEGTPIQYSYSDKIGETDGNKYVYNIITLHQVSTTNVLDAIPKGMYGGTAATIDPLTKTFGFVDFDYQRDFTKLKHVENAASNQKITSSLWPYKDIAKRGVYKQILARNRGGNWISKGKNFELEWPTKEKILLTRMGQLQQATNHIKMRATIPGNSALQAGDIIKVDIPDMNTFDSTDPVQKHNPLFQGNYLVTAIQNVFTASQYVSHIELTKDCYRKSPEDELREELFR